MDVDAEMLVVAVWNSANPLLQIDEFPNNRTGHQALVERAKTLKPELVA